MPARLADICRRALKHLDAQQPLDTKELHRELYVDRGEPTMGKLRVRLELGALDGRKKLVFSGHIGSGKSTELYNLKRELDEQARATILYYPVKRHVNLVGMNATRLLESMARELELYLRKEHSPAFEEELRRANETYRRVRTRKEAVSAAVSAGPSAGMAEAEVGLRASRGTDQEWVYQELPDPASMLELVNKRVKEARERRGGAEVFLICDDLEKLDLRTAEQVFADGLALSEVDACVLYTVPIALLYSERSKALLGHFDDDWTVLPIIKVQDRNGLPLLAGVARLRSMVEPRVPELEQVFGPGAFDALALASGGVLRDLIRMVRDVCLRVVASGVEEALSLADVKQAESEIRRSFGRQVPSELIPRLERVATESSTRGMDPELARLLNLAAVLEYANDDTWYRVHPLASHLFGDPVVRS